MFSKISSAELWDTDSKYLDVILISIKGTAYLMENNGQNVEHFISVIENVTKDQKVVNYHIEGKLGECLTMLSNILIQ